MTSANKYISIPPFISAPWEQVSSLHMNGESLCVTLRNGQVVTIPSLSDEQLNQIFGDHAAHMNGTPPSPSKPTPAPEPQKFQPDAGGIGAGTLNPSMLSGLRLGLGGIGGFEQAMQHNPEMGSAPDLPRDMLEKISSVARIMAPGEIDQMPKGEPHCNCIYCQIARAIHGNGEAPEQIEQEEIEPEVDDSELSFREWDIAQEGENLYRVTNPLNEEEKYSVFLGEPVGCTCGLDNCEHVIAVLRS